MREESFMGLLLNGQGPKLVEGLDEHIGLALAAGLYRRMVTILNIAFSDRWFVNSDSVDWMYVNLRNTFLACLERNSSAILAGLRAEYPDWAVPEALHDMGQNPWLVWESFCSDVDGYWGTILNVCASEGASPFDDAVESRLRECDLLILKFQRWKQSYIRERTKNETAVDGAEHIRAATGPSQQHPRGGRSTYPENQRPMTGQLLVDIIRLGVDAPKEILYNWIPSELAQIYTMLQGGRWWLTNELQSGWLRGNDGCAQWHVHFLGDEDEPVNPDGDQVCSCEVVSLTGSRSELTLVWYSTKYADDWWEVAECDSHWRFFLVHLTDAINRRWPGVEVLSMEGNSGFINEMKIWLRLRGTILHTRPPASGSIGTDGSITFEPSPWGSVCEWVPAEYGDLWAGWREKERGATTDVGKASQLSAPEEDGVTVRPSLDLGVLQFKKAGAPRKSDYDRSYTRLRAGESASIVFEDFCEAAGIKCRDKGTRANWKSAMRYRKKMDAKKRE